MAVPVQADARLSLGDLLRRWRAQRRVSQLDLAVRAGVSSRHLSFVETGRARPSRELVLHLAEHLDVPLRERNLLLLAAGYAPVFRHTPLDAPDMAAVREAVDVTLRHHEPFPALAVDRAWNVVAANAGVDAFVALLPTHLRRPPINAVRASLHPEGLAPLVENFDEYAGHLVARLRRQREATGDHELEALLDEVLGYPRVASAAEAAPPPGVVLTMRLHDPSSPQDVLSFFTTMTVFGAPLDVTLAELAIEAFFPADDRTRAAFAGS